MEFKSKAQGARQVRVVFDNYGNISEDRERHRGDPTLQKMGLASGTKSHFLQVMTQEIRDGFLS